MVGILFFSEAIEPPSPQEFKPSERVARAMGKKRFIMIVVTLSV
jgi:hypothetical protein